MKRIPMRWAIASALVAIVAAGCTTTTDDTTTADGGGTGGSTGTGGSAGTGGTTGTGGGEAEAGTGGTAETDAETPGPCEACVYGNCPAAGAACEADPDCKSREDTFYDCLAAGGMVGDCGIPFAMTDPGSDGGGNAANDVASCVDANCVPMCGPASDAGTAGD